MHGGDPATARALAHDAAALALGAGVRLPDELLLWDLAGGCPSAPAEASPDPARALGERLERALAPAQRRAGSHHTPAALAAEVVARALEGAARSPAVVDPACGGGALLLAAADQLVAAGLPREHVAQDLLWGADVDPLAAAVTEAAVALWSGGVAPAPGHIVVADTLAAGARAWPATPVGGFGAVVGNPPFQGQLGRGTVRSADVTAALRARFGAAVGPYTDTAAIFLLLVTELARAGARAAMVVPQSIAAARDAAAVRDALAARARLVEVWMPPGRAFDAQVDVCVAVLQVLGAAEPGAAGDRRRTAARQPPGATWADRLAAARGVPAVDLRGGCAVGELAAVIAGFRDEYYGLVGHVREAGATAGAPLVTSGSIDVGRCTWGEVPVRFAKQRWTRPEVDLASLAEGAGRVASWVARVRRPKAVVASQTRVLEASADHAGTWVPVTPVVSVVPHDAAQLDRLVAAICAPPAAAWAARTAAGSALSPGAIRVGAPLVERLPLPRDEAAWDEAVAALAAGDLATFAAAGTAMHRLDGATARAVVAWWHAQRPRRQARG